jgi:PAS domain S-box
MTPQEGRKETIRVLHVDDNVEFAEMATTFLEGENDRFETETVASASDGLGRLADSSFDCVISDYDMPDQNGIEFLKTVRDNYPELPFILFTGKGSEKVASEAISAGVTDYLQKSAGTEQYELLAHRITNAVEQSQAEQRLHEEQQRVQQEQQRVQQEQQRLRTLFDRLSQPTVEVQYENDEPIVTQVNSAFENVFGVASDTIVGDSLDTHIVPDGRIDEAEAINQHVQAGGRLESREVIRETADGLRKFLIQNAVYSDDDRVGGFAIYTDITDRRKREEALERNRDLLRHTEQLATVGGWEADIETGEISWTQGTYAIHDLDPAGEFEPSIETTMEFYHPDDQATIQQAVEKCRTQGEAYEVDVRLITAEDEQKWVCITGEAVYDEDGDDITKIRGAVCDITDIQRKKQELAELKQQYQTLGDNFPDGAVYLINENFEYIRARGEALKRADLSPADIEGHTPHEVFPDELADKSCKQFEQAFSGNTTAFEQEYRDKQYRIRVTPVDGNRNTTKTKDGNRNRNRDYTCDGSGTRHHTVRRGQTRAPTTEQTTG